MEAGLLCQINMIRLLPYKLALTKIVIFRQADLKVA